MSVNLKMVKRMVRESKLGKMVQNKKESGNKEKLKEKQ